MSTQRVDSILNPTTFGTVHINRSGRYSDFVEDVRTTHRTLVKIIATFQTRPKMSTGDKDSVAPLLKADHTKDISKFFADFRKYVVWMVWEAMVRHSPCLYFRGSPDLQRAGDVS